MVYRTTVTPDHDWIQFELEGSLSNRDAIGAEVEVFWNGSRQIQVVTAGSGFSAQNSRRLHFGLGPDRRVDRAMIRWPSGAVQTLSEPAPRALHRVREPEETGVAMHPPEVDRSR